ncbi:hypothetical protein A2230_04720 [candidate division WOR-1 bacterium RIFOXYA2_FULL_36_21]|nr:MAG: hypothetical protein A2230_04720 [candidate division WOR-1 bacterium RIFOXYA2_FULL_36_21]
MSKKAIKIKHIAKELNISCATVSQAFNHPRQVNRKTRQKILELCQNIGYIHKKNKGQRHKNISILALNEYVPFTDFYARVSIGILQEAQKHGFNIIIEPFGNKNEEIPKSISKSIIDGSIIMGPIPKENVLKLQQYGTPIVLCGHPIPELELNCVIPDGRSGMYQATKHLIALGHKKIAFILGGPVFDPVSSDRLEGYRFAMYEEGLDIPTDYITKTDFSNHKNTPLAAEKLLNLSNPPTAIICSDDSIAFIVYNLLKSKNFKIPKDISLIGFDDARQNDSIFQYLPPLTTVQVNIDEIGKTAFNVLLDIIENPNKAAIRYTLPVKLIVRNTTAKIKN